MITHEVLNQAPERVGVNEFESNAALVDGVRIWGAGTGTSTNAGITSDPHPELMEDRKSTRLNSSHT